MPIDKLKRYNDFLDSIADSLDVPPSTHQKIVASYQAVGEWLDGGDYEGSMDGVSIHPQGSFAIGTVIKPLRKSKKAGYDIDLVCQLSIPKGSTSPQYIKEVIGKRLQEHGTYKGILRDEGKRCWTLEYAKVDGIGFHLDVLPSVAESPDIIERLRMYTDYVNLVGTTIAITNKDPQNAAYSWTSSNPRGFSEWFKIINNPVFQVIASKAKQQLFENNRLLFASVDAVPDQLVRTPLQKAIQIMKRHRDIRFSEHKYEEFKPISMIITTLAALLYDDEVDVISALSNITEKLRLYVTLMDNRPTLVEGNLIERKSDGTWYIGNPVNKLENFADRWHEDNGVRAEAFFQWVSWIYDDLIDIANKYEYSMLIDNVKKHFEEYPDDKIASVNVATATPTIIKPHIEINNPSKAWYNTDV